MKSVRESDWKLLRQLKPLALDRFCSRTLSNIAKAASNPAETPHQRYLKVYELIHDRDKELGRMFDELSRSNALGKLFLMRSSGLLTDDEWADFSDETRNVFDQLQDI